MIGMGPGTLKDFSFTRFQHFRLQWVYQHGERFLNILVRIWRASYQEKTIKSLDGLRAISILMVICGHLSFAYGASFPQAAIYFSLMQSTGVSLFFVISGFLINGFLIKEKKQSGSINLKLFYFKRMFRIFPPYYFYLTVMIFILPFFEVNQLTKVEIASAFSYLWNYIYSTENWFFGHSWSLAVEEQFYMTWPFLLAFISIKWSKRFSVLIFFLTPLIRVGSYYLFPEWRPRLSIMFHTRMDTLLFGCFLAYYYQFISKENFQRVARKINRFYLPMISLVFLVGLSPYLRFLFKGSYTMTIGYSLEGVSMVILLVYVLTMDGRGKIFTILNHPVLRQIGVLSYGLYLWQQFFLAHTVDFGSTPLRLFYLYGTVILLYFILEYPLGRLSKKLQQSFF